MHPHPRTHVTWCKSAQGASVLAVQCEDNNGRTSQASTITSRGLPQAPALHIDTANLPVSVHRTPYGVSPSPYMSSGVHLISSPHGSGCPPPPHPAAPTQAHHSPTLCRAPRLCGPSPRAQAPCAIPHMMSAVPHHYSLPSPRPWPSVGPTAPEAAGRRRPPLAPPPLS